MLAYLVHQPLILCILLGAKKNNTARRNLLTAKRAIRQWGCVEKGEMMHISSLRRKEDNGKGVPLSVVPKMG